MKIGLKIFYLAAITFFPDVFGTMVRAADKEYIIIESGQSVPNSAYWREYGEELDKLLPFDGVALQIEFPVTRGGTMELQYANTLTLKVFQKEKITEEMVKPFVDDMRAAGLKTLQHNMVLTNLRAFPHTLDYFDDDWWETICSNIHIVAKAARETGCAGLVIDPEQYGGDRCWDYSNLVSRTKLDKPWEEYVAKVRQRGKEFGSALSEGFPDCKLLFYFGHSYTAGRLKRAGLREVKELGDLYWAFLDGMLEGTSEGTVFVEGMEWAYGYAAEADNFIDGRRMALYEPLAFTAVPDLFRQKVRCGFGLWLDNNYNGFTYYPFSPDLNRYNPGRFQRLINLALKYGDGYVWIWNEQANWFVDGPKGEPHPPSTQRLQVYGVDEKYRQAVREAKIWPGADTSVAAIARADAKTLGFVEGRELEKLLARSTKLVDLPNDGWLFRSDRNLVGITDKWYSPATSPAKWDSLWIGEFWEFKPNTDPRESSKYAGLNGVAWYRRQIAFEDPPKNKRLYLHFGGVDESCQLWIDGKYVGAYDKGSDGANAPFAIEVTGFITDGKHTLVVRIHDTWRNGGISKGVVLIAE